MWPLAVAVFAMAIVTMQFAKSDSTITRFDEPRDNQTAKQAMLYASYVSTYLRNNPGASSPATPSQLNLPAWFPTTCAGQPCFNNAFAGGKGYITPKAQISLPLDSIYKAQDGSIVAGAFTNVSTGSFQSQYGVITLPVPAGASVNVPTIVVGP